MGYACFPSPYAGCMLFYARMRAHNARTQSIMVDGRDVVPDVWEVLDRIRDFSNKVRSGEWKGATGKNLKNVVAIGIGGSFLGPLFVHTALRWVLRSQACCSVEHCADGVLGVPWFCSCA